jgi:hypothetical protein
VIYDYLPIKDIDFPWLRSITKGVVEVGPPTAAYVGFLPLATGTVSASWGSGWFPDETFLLT